MLHGDETQLAHLDPKKASAVTESGELERPVPQRRKIDCGGNTEIADRRDVRSGGRRDSKLPKAS